MPNDDTPQMRPRRKYKRVDHVHRDVDALVDLILDNASEYENRNGFVRCVLERLKRELPAS